MARLCVLDDSRPRADWPISRARRSGPSPRKTTSFRLIFRSFTWAEKLLCKGAPRLSTTRPPTAARDTRSCMHYADDATPWAQMARANGFPQILPIYQSSFFRSAHGAFGDDALAVGLSHLGNHHHHFNCGHDIPDLKASSFRTRVGDVCIDVRGGLFLLPLQKHPRLWPSQCLDSVHLDSGCVPSQTSKADGFRLVLRLGDGVKGLAGCRRAAPRPAPAVAVAGGLRDGRGCFHRGFHLAIRLADQPDLADGDLPEHFFRGGKYLQPLIRRPRRCAVRSPVFRHAFHFTPNGPFLPD